MSEICFAAKKLSRDTVIYLIHTFTKTMHKPVLGNWCLGCRFMHLLYLFLLNFLLARFQSNLHMLAFSIMLV